MSGLKALCNVLSLFFSSVKNNVFGRELSTVFTNKNNVHILRVGKYFNVKICSIKEALILIVMGKQIIQTVYVQETALKPFMVFLFISSC